MEEIIKHLGFVAAIIILLFCFVFWYGVFLKSHKKQKQLIKDQIIDFNENDEKEFDLKSEIISLGIYTMFIWWLLDTTFKMILTIVKYIFL
jgi:H+/gluconate symporter-like permease